MAQPEARIVGKVLSELNSLPMCKAEKNHGTQFGKPKLDISGAINGLAFHIEIKVPGNKPTARQARVIKDWQKVGVAAGWATNVEEALSIIQSLREGHHG